MQEAHAAGLQGRFLYHDNEADELGYTVSVGESMESRTRRWESVNFFHRPLKSNAMKY